MDPDGDSIRQIVLLILLLAFSAFFSASETALTSLSKIRLRTMLEQNDKNAVKIERITRNPDRFLASILVGNNLVNVACSSIAAGIAINLSDGNDWVLTLTTLIVTVAILIFGEITPKTIAARNAEKISGLVSYPIGFFMALFKPVVFVLSKITGALARLAGGEAARKTTITESELKTLVNVSQQEGILEAGEREMITNVFDFGDSRARDVMTPRTEIIALPVNSGYKETMEAFRSERFSRLPVYREDLDHIVGVLHFKDFILSGGAEKDFKLEQYMRDPIFSYESKLTLELLAQMRQANSSIAVILDEYGGTSGILTFEDLIEEIVGDIYDEYEDSGEDISYIAENEYLVEGLTRIDDFNELAGTKLYSEDYETLGGYAMGMFGRIPCKGETAELDNIKVVIEEMDRNRIDRLRVLITVPPRRAGKS